MSKITNRATLKENVNNPQKVLQLIDALNLAFKKQFKRNPNASLVYSDLGVHKSPNYGVGVWYSEDDIDEVNWFKEQISLSK